LEFCKDKRVSVVLARQELHKKLTERPSDAQASRAAELLDRVLEHFP
jgi:hypothetical protein